MDPTAFISLPIAEREYLESGSSSRVYRSVWNDQAVALKIFRSEMYNLWKQPLTLTHQSDDDEDPVKV